MTLTGVISYPIPPYSNVPIEPQFYQPSRFLISAITLGITTTVTATTDMNYVIAQLVRLIIPLRFGSRQLNEQQGYVIAIPASNQVEIAINSLDVDPFIASPTFLPSESQTKAQILAIGDVGNGTVNSSGRINLATTIPGAFINISPL